MMMHLMEDPKLNEHHRQVSKAEIELIMKKKKKVLMEIILL
jgi:hypothetical protein